MRTQKETEAQIAINKAWCFDTGVSLERINDAWKRALDPGYGNRIIKNFAEHGMAGGLELPNHLLIDLLRRYPG